MEAGTRTRLKQVAVLAAAALALSVRAAPEVQQATERGLAVARILARHGIQPVAELGLRQVAAYLPARIGDYLRPETKLLALRKQRAIKVHRTLVFRVQPSVCRRGC